MSVNALYTDLSGYYDLMCVDIDYQAQSHAIRRLHQIFGNEGKRHLDLACGTGPHVRYFLDAGYTSSGLDINQPMLDIAAQRCPEAHFSLQDMSSFEVDEPLDLITCFLYSIHYSDGLDKLGDCIASAHRALNEGGVFCFNAVDKQRINNALSAKHTAQQAGATFLSDQEVLDWSVEGSSVTVRTKSDQFHADRLVITAGSWTKDLLRDLGFQLRILRKPLHWYGVAANRYQCSQGAPTYFYDTPAGYFYGFPAIDERGLKVARHTGGTLVEDPLAVDRSLDEAEQAEVAAFLRKFLPEVSPQATDHTVCLYSMSADEHFIVDRHPGHDQVVFAAGLSGHGFKFATVLGKILADLAVAGTTALPIGFLGHDRAGLQSS